MDYEKELTAIEASTDMNGQEETENRRLVLYGAGSLGKMAVDIMKHTDRYPVYIVDKMAQGQIGNLVIRRLNELSEDIKENALFLVTICTVPFNSVKEELISDGIRHIMPFYTYAYRVFPRWLSNGWFVSQITPEIKNKILIISGLLAHDTYSLHHYMQFCWWKLRGREMVYEDCPVLSGRKYFAAPCMPDMGSGEFLIDCGCHVGITIKQFMQAAKGKFRGVLAFEPDLYNLEKAKKNIADSRVTFDKRAVAMVTGTSGFMPELGFASKLEKQGKQTVRTVALDELNISPTIIKIHVEGSEYEVMKGAVNTIKRCRPILMVFADHTVEGLYEIPAFVQELKSYHLFFYLHDYCGNSAVFYMIPDERMKTYESRI